MDNLVNHLLHQPVIFIGGKGGVGKTTHAASIACCLAARQHKVLLVSTDPAHSLADVLQTPLSGKVQAVTEWLSAVELNPKQMTDIHFQQVEATMISCAKPEMRGKLKQHLDAARTSPGAEEAAILETLCHYITHFSVMGFEQLIFDTAPTGHTLRLLELPQLMSAWTEGLLTQQGRQQRLYQAALPFWQKSSQQNTLLSEANNQRWQQALEVLQKRRQLFTDAGKSLADASHTRIVLVMTAEMLPLAETRRTLTQLQQCNLPCHQLIINQLMPEPETSDLFWQQRYIRQQQILRQIKNDFQEVQQHYYALQAGDIRGMPALIQFGRQGQIDQVKTL